MPVSKKRKKHNQPKREQKHKLVVAEGDTVTCVAPFICYHPFIDSKPSVNVVYKSGEPCAVKSRFLDYYTENKKDRILEVKNYAESIFNDYITHTVDFDQALNIWNKSPNIPAADTLDFSEFTKNAYAENIDITEKAYDIINEPGFEFDPSWIWSTNKYIDIILSPRLMYKLLRIGYNEDRQSVMYGFTEYEKFMLDDDTCLTVPMFQGVIDLYGEKFFINDNGKVKIRYSDKLEFDEYYARNGNFMKSVADSCISKYGNGFNTVRIDLLGVCYANTIMLTEHKNIAHIKNNKRISLYNTVVDIISQYGVKEFDETKNLPVNEQINWNGAYRIVRATSAITAALIVSNKLLKDKKLSKPIKTHTIAEDAVRKTEIDIRNMPERKTRVLGGNIKIASSERPAVPSMERVIKYHVLEWGRKEHFRKLKSGKIVHVNASRCVRKCADKADKKSKNTKQATDYKIKPEQNT